MQKHKHINHGTPTAKQYHQQKNIRNRARSTEPKTKQDQY